MQNNSRNRRNPAPSRIGGARLASAVVTSLTGIVISGADAQWTGRLSILNADVTTNADPVVRAYNGLAINFSNEGFFVHNYTTDITTAVTSVSINDFDDLEIKITTPTSGDQVQLIFNGNNKKLNAILGLELSPFVSRLSSIP